MTLARRFPASDRKELILDPNRRRCSPSLRSQEPGEGEGLPWTMMGRLAISRRRRSPGKSAQSVEKIEFGARRLARPASPGHGEGEGWLLALDPG